MEAGAIGRGLVYVGLGIAGIGGLVWALGQMLDLGSLPGDLVYEGDDVQVYAPVGTMIVLSIVLTVLLNLVLRLFR